MVFLLILILLCNICLVLIGVYVAIGLYRLADKYDIILPFMKERRKQQEEEMERAIQDAAYTRMLEDLSKQKKATKTEYAEPDLSGILDELPGKPAVEADEETLLDILEYGIPDNEWNAVMDEVEKPFG